MAKAREPQIDFVVEEAVRDQALLRLLLQGPSWAGKTTSALVLATGMVGALRKRGLLPDHLQRFIGLVCTEQGSAKKARGRFQTDPFDILILDPPYSPARYMAALSKMERIGYPVIILDQITHEWAGPGGVLSMVSEAQASNDFAAWNGPSQQHEEFIDRLQHCPSHLICTGRAKTEWTLVEKVNRAGKTVKVPERIGMQVRQREGTEYEFDVVLDLRPGSNEVRCIKDRMGFFEPDVVYQRLGLDAGAKFIDWIYAAPKALEAGAGPTPEERAGELADAAKRALGEVATLPELQLVWAREQRVLQDFSTTAGKEVMGPLIKDVTAVKDRRKAVLSGAAPSDLIVRDLDPADLTRPASPVPGTEHQNPLEVVRGTMERIAARRPGLFQEQAERARSGGFSEMKDDLPWEDDDPGGSAPAGMEGAA